MALRDQPYLPLYIQDYLTDEKLNMCSWETQGIYIKILCLLHKQEEYGKILFKQNSKQTESNINYYASYLVRQIPCQLSEMENALEELIDFDVLQLTKCCLAQKRMVKDGEISLKRAEAGRKGGGNPRLLKQKPKQEDKQRSKQTDKQNPEYENEYEYTNEDVVKGGMGESAEPQNNGEQKPDSEYSVEFEMWWNLYDKKVGDKKKLMAKWRKIPKREIGEIFKHTKRYVQATPDKKYRKNPQTYLNNESWNDEIIESDGKQKQSGHSRPTTEELAAAVEMGTALADFRKGQ